MNVKKIIVSFVLWVVIVNCFAVLALNRFNLKSDTAYTWIDPNQFSQNQQWNPVSLHAHWDSFWYLDIAQNGYIFKGPEKLSNIVFFPLYPLLIRAASFFIGGNFIFAGWILSLIFLFLALFYFSRLVREFHNEINYQLPLALLLIFPTAFFLNAIYTESLFLFLSIAAFYYAFKKKFCLAGIFGFFASLTRVTGILLFIPLIWEYFKNFKFHQPFNENFLSIFLVPLGTLGFFLFHYFKFGDFFLFLKVEGWWGRAFSLNKDHFLLLTNPAAANLFTDLLFVIFAIIATYFVFKKLRTSYGLYMSTTLLVALGTGTFMSIGRYLLVLFPIFILIALVKNQRQQLAYIFFSTLLLAMNIILFVNNYWAG
ncbi:MAG: mannosyltransferase family protein [bacterium]